MKNKWMALPILILTLFMIYFLGKPLRSELAPLDDRNWLRISMIAPEGVSFDYMDNYVQKAVKIMMDSIPENEGVLAVTAPGFAGSGGANTAFGRIALADKSERVRSQHQIAEKLNAEMRKLPDAKVFASEQQTIALNKRGGLPVQYVLQAPNFEKLRDYLPKFIQEVQSHPTFTMSDVDLKFNKPELNISIDREKAKSMGVSVSDVAQTMQLAFAGQRFGYFNMNGRQYSVIGQFDRNDRNEPIDLTNLYVKNNTGELVQLDNIVKAEEQSNPPQLYHYNQYMSATVSAGLATDKTIADGIIAMDEIKEKLNDPTIKSALTGSSRDFQESSSNTLFSFGLAILLVFLILAAQFESFRDPLIIMLTVPLAIAGAIFSLWFFDQSLNIFSQIGIIMLVGLVTKNGILIVEFANQMREKGMNKQEAVIHAATMRLRPILMTTFATVLGAAPIAFAIGAAGASRMSMGIVVMGGLLFSLVLTLYVIPAMYSYLSGHKDYERMRMIDSIKIDEPETSLVHE